MIKVITYKGNTYEVQHERIQERRPNGFIEHVLSILRVNNRTLEKAIIKKIRLVGFDGHDNINLILETKKLINSYIAEGKIEYAPTRMFENWDGNLDN